MPINKINKGISDWFRSGNAFMDLQQICHRADIPRFSVHVLRHTFATRCVEAGMNPKTLQNILGHSNISTMMDIYAHSTEDNRAKEMQDIEFMLNII